MTVQKVIYICHEYGNDYKNADKVADLILSFSVVYPDLVFVSPIHTFGFMYMDVPYDHGMKMCLTLLDLCDEMWIFGDKSKSRGCMIEREYCKRYNIQIGRAHV